MSNKPSFQMSAGVIARGLRAIVLLSGGLDSTTVLALAKARGLEIQALSFRYGQRHVAEIASAERIAIGFGVSKHTIIDIDLSIFGMSALTTEGPIPKDRDEASMASAIPVTYVPARNTIFLAYALALAEVWNAEEIHLGVSAIDYSGYPDCRPAFVASFENLANLAIASAVSGERKIRIIAPLQHLSKAETIKLGKSVGVDYSLTRSCYDPSAQGLACGHCDSCLLRAEGFRRAGVSDPTSYVGGPAA